MNVTTNKGQANVYSWTVSSTFGTAQNWQITLILSRASTKNDFYEKHVLREGESSKAILDDRLRGAPGNPANVQSTSIRLKQLDLHQMLTDMASAMLQAYNNGVFTTPPAGLNIYVSPIAPDVVFQPAHCVVTRGGANNGRKNRSVIVGGYLRANNPPLLTFEITHCNGGGAT